MAFPPVVNRSNGTTASGTSHAVGLPDGCNVSGRLLVIIAAIRGGASGTISTPAGFTAGWADEIGPGGGTLTPIFACRYRVLDGTEGYPATGATQTLTSSDTNTMNFRAWLFEAGQFDNTTPLETLTAEGTSVTPDPPSLSVTGGARDVTFIACNATGDDTPVITYPTNYSTGQITQGSSSSQLQAAERELNAASENPGVFTNNGSLNWIAATIAIRPSASVTVTLGTGSLIVDGAAPSADPSNPQPPSVPASDVWVWAVAGTPNDVLLRDPSGPAPVAGAALVTVPTGALALSGPAPQYLTSGLQRITPPTGALRFGRPHTADTGRITADSGLITGDIGAPQGAPIVVVSTAGPKTGQLILTGFAPTVQAGSNKVASPATGSLILAGIAALVIIGTVRVPTTGALTLAGVAPVAQIGTVRAPATGALTLTGIAPVVVNGTVRTPATGALTLTGVAPVVFNAINRAPLTGALTLTGVAPLALVGTNISIGTGALALSGVAPVANISDHKTVSPATGALVLTGVAPVVVTPRTVTPATGALVLAGVAPSIQQAVVRAPGTGQLVLTGIAPEARYSIVVALGTGQLVLTGHSPLTGVPGSGSSTGMSTTQRTTGMADSARESSMVNGDYRVTAMVET